jgi:hypothetical protein
MSQYLQLREQNISRNRAALAAIGLDECVGALAAATDKLKAPTKRAAPAATGPTMAPPRSKLPRTCRRKDGASGSFVGAATVTPLASQTPARDDPLPEFVRVAFAADADADAAELPASAARWHSKRHHQHLTVSPSGQSVATTGCAGYGVAIAASASGCHSWLVQAVHHGVGGFGVGLAYPHWKGPFKSIGSASTADAFGVYHSSGAFISQRREHASWGPPYAPGDSVGVQVDTTSGSVTFSVNNQEVGPAPGLVPVGLRKKVELAVQPFMGGVARLLHAPGSRRMQVEPT